MVNLCNFSCYSTANNRFSRFRDVERSLTLPSDSKATCSLTHYHLLDGSYRSYSAQDLEWCSASLKHLAIMINDGGPFKTVHFPNLQVLELHFIDKQCTFSSETCPNLKAVYLNTASPDSISVNGLPASVEKLWLSWNHASFWSIGLSQLDSSLPHLKDLRLEEQFPHSSKVFDLIRARRLAVEQEFEVRGIKMKPIKKLTVSKGKFSNENWSELGRLVEELVNVEDAPKVEEICL